MAKELQVINDHTVGSWEDLAETFDYSILRTGDAVSVAQSVRIRAKVEAILGSPLAMPDVIAQAFVRGLFFDKYFTPTDRIYLKTHGSVVQTLWASMEPLEFIGDSVLGFRKSPHIPSLLHFSSLTCFTYYPPQSSTG